MNKKEKKQFEKKLKNDILIYLVNSDIKDLDNYKEVNKYLKKFANKYYQEIEKNQSVEEPGLYSGADWVSNIYERKNSKAKRR